MRQRTWIRAGRARPAPPPHGWSPGSRLALALAVVIALAGAVGVGLYLNERASREHAQLVGSAPTEDYLLVEVTLQRVDAGANTLIAKALVQPQGALAAADNAYAPAGDLELNTTSLEQTVLRYPARQPIGATTVSFSLSNGRISDYPFDRYRANIGFQATAGGRPVPVVLGVHEADPFFAIHRTSEASEQNVVVLSERVNRSRSTFILAWFMIVSMWALGLSVLAAAWVITQQRRGLVWPALGWMAATLFALVGMRNAAPGSPPIGSLLDYAAFYWAEAMVITGLTVTVVRGVLKESRGRGTV